MHTFLDADNICECGDPDCADASPAVLPVFDGNYLIAAYEIGQAYGGPEEGGWWYDTGELIRVIRVVASEERARDLCSRANDLIRHLQRKRRPVTSVLYSGGRYTFRVCQDNQLDRYYPTERPHYE